jgi:hypothetical protein
MKIKHISFLIVVALCALRCPISNARAQGTAFTYQGRLSVSNSPANGLYDFTFTLWNGSSGGGEIGSAIVDSAVGVTNGLFIVTLDFGPGSFTGQSLWLQSAVESNGVSPFVTLSPRQQLTPTPYSIFAENSAGVNNASISAPQLNAGTPASGQVLEYNGSSLQWTTPSSSASGWSLTGNAGTIPGTDFLGTTDDEPLELWVNGARAFRLEPANGGANVVGGSSSSADVSVNGGTIAGGIANTLSNLYPTVSGGEYNHATANGAVIGGGYNNTASGREATIGGGAQNMASGAGAVVGGGGYDGTTEAGNTAGGPATVVGGGLQNGAFGMYDTVPGGSFNTASGGDSFAAGHQAKALHLGSFVWADSIGGAFQSTANNQFSVRADGGVRLVTGGNGTSGLTLDGYEVLTTATGGGGGGITNGWLLTGNTDANPANGFFLGTVDTNGFELHVDGSRGLRLDYASESLGGGQFLVGINVNGGYFGNIISNGVIGGTIAGGGSQSGNLFTPAVSANIVTGDYGTVGGGGDNTAGYGATVPGGLNNVAKGKNSFAAGNNAAANDNGSFVWGDGTRAAVSQGADSFSVLATGGIYLFTGANGLQLDPATSVYFGSQTRQMLNLYGSTYGIGVQSSTVYQRTAAGGGFAWFAGGVHNDGQDNSGGGTTVMTLDGSGNLNVTANASVCSLTIRGGCDLAEPFQFSSADNDIPQGAVVVIDEENPGHLKLSDEPYDARVAGVVSGANGIHPGIQMQQEGLIEGGKNVALTGRVYVQADVSNGAIKPGDLLTTSSIPGRAMRVSDHLRAQGAILGKAMTSLNGGQGMVLVLVTLQ